MRRGDGAARRHLQGDVVLRILGIDPGLTHCGLCILDGSDVSTTEVKLADGVEGWQVMADLILAWIASTHAADAIHVIGLEDYVFLGPKVSRGAVKYAAQMAKIIGYLVAKLTDAGHELVLVRSSDAQRDQPKGRAAKAAGIPGRNGHERCAYNVANWLRGTMRLAGRR